MKKTTTKEEALKMVSVPLSEYVFLINKSKWVLCSVYTRFRPLIGVCISNRLTPTYIVLPLTLVSVPLSEYVFLIEKEKGESLS